MIRHAVMISALLPCLLISGCIAYSGPLTGRTTSGPALEACRRAIFEQADGNSDGVLESAEAAAAPLSWPRDFFERADGNGDGVIDQQEYEELLLFVRCEMCPRVADCAS